MLPAFALAGTDVFLLATGFAAGCGALVLWRRHSPGRARPGLAQGYAQRGGGSPEPGVIGIFICDSKGNILEANEQFLKMIGYSREEIDRKGYPALSAV